MSSGGRFLVASVLGCVAGCSEPPPVFRADPADVTSATVRLQGLGDEAAVPLDPADARAAYAAFRAAEPDLGPKEAAWEPVFVLAFQTGGDAVEVRLNHKLFYWSPAGQDRHAPVPREARRVLAPYTDPLWPPGSQDDPAEPAAAAGRMSRYPEPASHRSGR